MKLIYYNAEYINRYFTYGRNARQIAPIITGDRKALELWRRLYALLHTRYMLLDRSQTLPPLFDMEVLRPLPGVDHRFRSTFADLCLERASDLAARGPIRLFWSGGIDSTAALVAFLHLGHTPEVVLSRESINEYPEFFASYIHNALDYFLIEPYPHENFTSGRPPHTYKNLPCLGEVTAEGKVNVSGALGDKLFNSTRMMNFFGWENAKKDYRDCIPSELVELLGPVLKSSPVEIETLHDFCWYISFCLFFQDELLHMPLGAANSCSSIQAVAARTEAFFDSSAFEQWALHNYRQNTATDIRRSKEAAKQFIFAFTKDNLYLVDKTKVGSLRYRNPEDRMLFVTHRGEVIRDNPFLEEGEKNLETESSTVILF